ncbi:hypothetical protein GGR57DRAFT_240188 [Xylariaceae sp. FL1272]|nr:hypothetical protein GGR57DRAFT_240188 [Xylariaceae sp. FL1272]
MESLRLSKLWSTFILSNLIFASYLIRALDDIFIHTCSRGSHLDIALCTHQVEGWQSAIGSLYHLIRSSPDPSTCPLPRY